MIGGTIDKPILQHYFKLRSRSTSIGFDSMLQEMIINKARIKFQNWLLHTNQRTVYFYGGLALIVFYHKNDRISYKEVAKWYRNFKKHSGRSIDDYPKDCLVIVGVSNNNEAVSTQEGLALANQLGMAYYETAIKDKRFLEDLPKIFFRLGEAYLEYVRRQQVR
ncbi:MAG: hypothetical protein ACFE9L_13135 [Candidatus Hodarchaeota archaeon]